VTRPLHACSSQAQLHSRPLGIALSSRHGLARSDRNCDCALYQWQSSETAQPGRRQASRGRRTVACLLFRIEPQLVHHTLSAPLRVLELNAPRGGSYRTRRTAAPARVQRICLEASWTERSADDCAPEDFPVAMILLQSSQLLRAGNRVEARSMGCPQGLQDFDPCVIVELATILRACALLRYIFETCCTMGSNCLPVR
jgi:hypothetical protein